MYVIVCCMHFCGVSPVCACVCVQCLCLSMCSSMLCMGMFVLWEWGMYDMCVVCLCMYVYSLCKMCVLCIMHMCRMSVYLHMWCRYVLCKCTCGICVAWGVMFICMYLYTCGYACVI